MAAPGTDERVRSRRFDRGRGAGGIAVLSLGAATPYQTAPARCGRTVPVSDEQAAFDISIAWSERFATPLIKAFVSHTRQASAKLTQATGGRR